jgi:protein-S-isoprenylcysteine O-methyltransferase Ste14
MRVEESGVKLMSLSESRLMVMILAGFWEAGWPATRIVGAVLGLVSVGLLLTARVQLGKSFAVGAEAKELVTTGLYSRIRSPMYVFVDCLLLSAALFFQTWWLVLIAVVLASVQWVRSGVEAKVLEAAFGEKYRAYRRSTWF